MTLDAGTRVGPYEILGPLGAGGMGEVYRARDTRIGRTIAIKVLPKDFETDVVRRQRFHQEAVAAGSLNHPNVLVVHDVGHDTSRPYLVTELLHGTTLRDILERGPIPMPAAIGYAAGVLDGLAAAHALGIVHRDLKPENIFITEDGVAKILDFGIARNPAGWIWSDGTAATSPATAEDLLLGTVGYMAPEQVTGAAVDARADLFSAGIVICEMVTGAAPFQRNTPIETLNAIVAGEPVLPPAGSPLHPILERALQKSPARRFQSAADFAFALRLARASHETPSDRFERPRSRGLGMLTAALAIAVVVLAFTLYRRAPVPSAVAVTYRRVTFQAGKIWSARFVPGGDTVAYSAGWNGNANRIFTTRAEFPTSVPLDLPPADLLGVSRSGEVALLLGPRWLQGMEGSSGMLARAGMSGTSPRELIAGVTAADWLPDGSQLAVVRDLGRVRRLEFPIGHGVYDTAGWIGTLRVSHDGTRVAFTDHPIRTDDRGDIATVDLRGKLSRVWTDIPSIHGVAWGPADGELWTCDSDNVVAIGADGTRRTVLHDRRLATLLDVADDGRLLLSTEERRVGLNGRLAGDAAERDLTWFDYSVARDLSPDGRSLLFFEAGAIAPVNYLIGLRQSAGAAPIRIGEGYPTSLSADGQWVLDITLSKRSGVRAVPVGAGEVREIPTPDLHDIHWATWHPDGRRIVLSAHEGDRGARIYAVDEHGQITSRAGPEGTVYLWNGVAPDGNRVAAQDPDRLPVVYSLDSDSVRPVPGSRADDRPVGWTDDGRSLFVLTPGVPARVTRVNVTSGERTPWRELLPADATGVVRISPVIVTPDGSAYAYSYGRYLSTLYVVSGAR